MFEAMPDKPSVAERASQLRDCMKLLEKPPYRVSEGAGEQAKSQLQELIATADAGELDDLLKRAVGKGIKLWRRAIAELIDCPENTVIDNWIREGLNSPDEDRSSWALQVVGHSGLTRFNADILRRLKADSPCWAAIMAAGDIGSKEFESSLLQIARTQPKLVPFALQRALQKCCPERAQSYFSDIFYLSDEDRDRVFAAQALAENGDTRALSFLIEVLPEKEDAKYYSHASRRSAQVLSAMYKWELEWTPDAPELALKLWNDEKAHLHELDCVTQRHFCFVFFEKRRITLKTAHTALNQPQGNCQQLNNALVAQRSEGPELFVRYTKGKDVLRQAKIVGSNTPYADDLARCDRRFEISFRNQENVLDEINSLIDVQMTLQSLTDGFLYLPWNEHLAPFERDA